MPVTRVGVQAVTGSPGQIVDIDPARITATITNVSAVTVEYSTGGAWTSIAAAASASVSCNTNELRLRRAGSGAYPAPVDIDWTAQSEGEANSLTAAQASAAAALVSGVGIAYADVATTAGTPNERRTLSDGPDAGVQLVWAIPEGSSTYAWCWAIYPLASYL